MASRQRNILGDPLIPNGRALPTLARITGTASFL